MRLDAPARAPDARISSALAHWAPRLLANGVDASDFQDIAGRVTRWSEWCATWMEAAARHEALAAAADARDAMLSAAEARMRAALYHHFARFLFFDDPAQAAVARVHMLALVRAAAPHLDPPIELARIPFAGAHLPAHLRRPGRPDRPPVVVLVPGLDSTKEEFYTFEPVFHARGMATLAIDGPGQGELDEALPLRPDYEAVLSAVLAWLAERPDVDGSRVAVAGVSLGGYFATRCAAYVPSLRAVAEIAGPYDWGDCWDTAPALTREAFTRRAGASGEATARALAHRFTLAGAAHRIHRPLLVVHGARDRLVPYEHAERLFAEVPAPSKQLQRYAEGNHVCNNLAYAYRPLVADWLARHLECPV